MGWLMGNKKINFLNVFNNLSPTKRRVAISVAIFFGAFVVF